VLCFALGLDRYEPLDVGLVHGREEVRLS
jgi:hypothetical protein